MSFSCLRRRMAERVALDNTADCKRTSSSCLVVGYRLRITSPGREKKTKRSAPQCISYVKTVQKDSIESTFENKVTGRYQQPVCSPSVAFRSRCLNKKVKLKNTKTKLQEDINSLYARHSLSSVTGVCRAF